jgi:replicative DNA helicase
MPRHEDLLISSILRGAGVRSAIKLGVSRDLFLRRRAEWMFLEGHPDVSKLNFKAVFPDFKVYMVDPEELPDLVERTRATRLDYELGQVFTKYQRMYGQSDSVELISKMTNELSNLITRFSRGNDFNLVKDWHKALDWVRQRKAAADSGTLLGYPFGIPTLDEELGGIQPPDLVTIVARQGEYKTWLSLYFAVRAMLTGAKVMYVSLEMSEEQLTFRIHTLLSRMLTLEQSERFKQVFSNTGLMMGAVDIREYRDFLRKSKKFISKGLVIPEAKDAGKITQFRAKIEELTPDVAFYDYFGLSIGESRVENWVEAANMSRGFKQICTEYNIPIVLNAQANRSAADSKETPRLDQIAYTDNLGRDSDRVFSLRLSRGQLTVYVAKNRFGEQGQKIALDLDIDKGVIDEVVRGSRRTGFRDYEVD